jgi:hypothetical protein
MFTLDRKPRPSATHAFVPKSASRRHLGPGTPTPIQRKCAGCEDEEKQTIQAWHAPSWSAEAVPDAEAAVRAARHGGVPLPDALRSYFEPRFGHDFSKVRVHADGEAADGARAVRARAYTLGRDIVFAAGEYAPATEEGQRLLAHELAHVVQQSRAPATLLGKGISSPGEPAEREADAAADAAMRGGMVPEIRLTGGGVQRDVGWAARGRDPWGGAESPWCEEPALSRRRQEGIRYGLVLSEAADTAATLEGGHPDDFNFVPEYRRAFLRRVGERSWAVSPPMVTIADDQEARCFIAGVNEGIRAFQESEIFWGKVAEGLSLLSVYLSARSFGQIAVSRGPVRTPPRLTIIRGQGGAGAPAPVVQPPPAAPPRPAAVAGGGGAVAVAPAQAPVVAPAATPRPRPVLVHSQPQPQAAAPPAPAPGPGVSPAVGVAAATQQQPQQGQPQCTPAPVCPHLGGDARHNLCADNAPPNRFPGCDVLVNGKRFDALQRGANILWEIKTDNYSAYSAFLRQQVIRNQIPELQREETLAMACGFTFVVGVVDAAHQAALLAADPTLTVVLTNC